ncbi:MAG: arylamine N-acetyltransferase [Steroidobacteraceae bacterium]
MDNSTLTSYLGRIGFEGPVAGDMPTLRQIVLRHVLSIPFENIAAFTGQCVSLVPADVEAKLIGRRRGGWCFEQNLLLGSALRALGFEVQDLAARVLWGRPETARTARTHRLLRVVCGGHDFIADVGFGGLTTTGILALDTALVQQTPHEPCRLRPLEDDLLLEAQVVEPASGDARWLPLYRFNLQPQWPIDFEAANFQLAHDPKSHFVTGLAVARAVPEGRYSLRDRNLTFRSRGHSEQRRLADAADLRSTLEEIFGLDTADMPGLEARFAALP